MNSVKDRIRRLIRREDFRRNPLRAVRRRIFWRLRWRLIPNKPWPLRAHGFFTFLTPQCEPGRYIYIQGASEPETARLIGRLLKPGMVFVDVGAHLGEYAVLASKIVEPHGSVCAFEPHPEMFLFLQKNVCLNACRNVKTCPEAAWDKSGFADFEVTSEPSRSAVRAKNGRLPSRLIRVRTTALDEYFNGSHNVGPSLIKIDVEGAELHVLRGARAFLSRPPGSAPVVIFEYAPSNTESFSYPAVEILRFLRELGYRIYDHRHGELVLLGNESDLSDISFERNLLAAKISPD